MNRQEQPKTKLSQWHALLLESLRLHGWSTEETLRRIGESDLPEDESAFGFDYAPLKELLAEEPETLERAIREGYQIKYNTIRGIKTWIAVAFGKEAELELEEGREAVVAELDRAQREHLESVLSYGWNLRCENGSPEGEHAQACRIEPQRG